MSRWHEGEHPRHPRGTPGGRGGEFAEQPDWAHRLDAQLSPPREYKQGNYGDLQINGLTPLGRAQQPGSWAIYDMLSESARRGVFGWTNDETRDALAARLRQGRPTSGVQVEDPLGRRDETIDLDEIRQGLDQALTESHTSTDLVLWRGLTLHPSGVDRLFPVGSEVTDLSYLSTSMDAQPALAILAHRLHAQGGEDAEQEGYLLKLLVPAGTPAAPGATNLVELILGRSLRARVLRREALPDHGDHMEGSGDDVIVLELIP